MSSAGLVIQVQPTQPYANTIINNILFTEINASTSITNNKGCSSKTVIEGCSSKTADKPRDKDAKINASTSFTNNKGCSSKTVIEGSSSKFADKPRDKDAKNMPQRLSLSSTNLNGN